MKMSLIEKVFVNRKGRELRIEALARRLLLSLDLSAKTDLLDIGCGTGAASRYVATNAELTVTAIDVDPDQIALARERAKGIQGIRFIEADATKMPFRAGEFDVVLSFMALHHIPNWRDALGEIQRVLRPDGYLVLVDVALPKPVSVAGALFGHHYALPAVDELGFAIESLEFALIRASPPGRLPWGRYERVYQRGASTALGARCGIQGRSSSEDLDEDAVLYLDEASV
jgi:SAM-dependent methyltransferase